MSKLEENKEQSKLTHSWRLCPPGRHWVRTHPLHTHASKKNLQGSETIRHGHCADNPSGKDTLYPNEISAMADAHFSKLTNRPCPKSLGFSNGDKFDDLISGWCKYWNDVLALSEPLESNLIKALIASESSFDENLLADKKNSNSARGLMQVTNDTRKNLGNEKGELKDHYLKVTKIDLNDPNINICAGIRWLFQKKKLADGKLGRQATWIESVANYKGVLKGYVGSGIQSKKAMAPFLKFLEDLKLCKKD